MLFSNVYFLYILIVQSEFHIHDDLYIYTRRTCSKFHMCSMDVKVKLFNTYCSPMYTAQLWWNHTAYSFQRLNVCYTGNNILRRLLRLTRYCSASGLFAQCGIPTGRAGVNSTPELEFIANSNSKSGIGIVIIGIELELPSLEYELNWNCHHWNWNLSWNCILQNCIRNWNPIWCPSFNQWPNTIIEGQHRLFTLGFHMITF